MSKCSSCRQQIIWVKLPSGKMMPVDPVPSKFGNLDMVDDPKEVDPPNVVFVKPSMAEMYRSHFSACPEAKAHRVKAVADVPAVAAKSKRGKNELTKAEEKAQRERVAYEQAMQHG